MRRIYAAFIAAAALFASPALAQSDGPTGLNPFSSGADSLAYAIEHGCLPYLRDGGTIHERVARESRGGEIADRPADRMLGRGDVQIQQDEHGSCRIQASRLDDGELREVVLATIARVASATIVVQDSGADSRDSTGPFRQERHCFSLNGQPAGIVMATSSNPRRPSLQLAIMIAREAPCLNPPTPEDVAARRVQLRSDLVERFAGAVGVCRAIAVGGAPEPLAQQAGYALGAPVAVAESSMGRTARAAGMLGDVSEFFGDAAMVRGAQMGRPAVLIAVTDSGSHCVVIAGAPPSESATLNNLRARFVGEMAGAAAWQAAGERRYVTPAGAEMRESLQNMEQGTFIRIFARRG